MSNKKENTPVTTQDNSPSLSNRFVGMVVKEIASTIGDAVEIPETQKRLAQNYFVKLDSTLKDADIKRAAKKDADPIAITWGNVNMNKLALDVMALTSVGLDPMQPNQVNMIPFKNKHTNQYDVTFILGYRGIELKAKKYGLDVPDDVVVDLVYSNDHFKEIKKDAANNIASYEFVVKNSFDRGDIIGGFYYHVFNSNPEKNKLVVFSIKDIEKRKPEYASVEFWGGEKTKWENGKPTGKEHTEGWYKEMCYKTVYRAAWNDITIDGTKIHPEIANTLRNSDEDRVESMVSQEIKANANKEDLSFNTEFTDVTEEVVRADSNGQTSIV